MKRDSWWRRVKLFFLYDELFHFVAAVLAMVVIAGLFLFSISCTKTVYRVKYVPQVTDSGCVLPKLGKLPEPQFKDGCLNIEGMKQLAERNSRMVQWIREVKARCGAQLDAGVTDGTKD